MIETLQAIDPVAWVPIGGVGVFGLLLTFFPDSMRKYAQARQRAWGNEAKDGHWAHSTVGYRFVGLLMVVLAVFLFCVAATAPTREGQARRNAREDEKHLTEMMEKAQRGPSGPQPKENLSE